MGEIHSQVGVGMPSAGGDWAPDSSFLGDMGTGVGAKRDPHPQLCTGSQDYAKAEALSGSLPLRKDNSRKWALRKVPEGEASRRRGGEGRPALAPSPT